MNLLNLQSCIDKSESNLAETSYIKGKNLQFCIIKQGVGLLSCNSDSRTTLLSVEQLKNTDNTIDPLQKTGHFICIVFGILLVKLRILP